MQTDTIENFIGGQWLSPDVTASQNVYNPSTGGIIGKTPLSDTATINEAVAAAQSAFPEWSNTPLGTRTKIIFRYRELLNENADKLAKLICLENGKTFAEAKGDVARGLEMVEFACNITHLNKGENLPQIANEIDAASSREPLGVCVGITPFNFPVMIPLWMFPLSIACGNTFILKPSERVPFSAQLLGKLFKEAGLPDGVFNIVHGGGETVNALCAHPDVKAISFVGSTRIAKSIYQTGTHHGKRVQAAGGAKNVLLVMPDADLDAAIPAIMGSAFGCAGQRCMAGSLLMGVDKIGDPLRERLIQAMENVKVDNTYDNKQADMGPVITMESKERLFSIIDNAMDKGKDLARDGRSINKNEGFFLGPTLIDQVNADDDLFRQELFGPVLSMLRPKNLDDAIRWMNSIPYGNGATIFTQNGAAARTFARNIQCGMVGINIGVPAPVPIFPFAGWNESFFGDLHLQGMEGLYFYTRQKVVLSRWDKNLVRVQGW